MSQVHGLKGNLLPGMDDDCEALWAMFGVDDLELEDTAKKAPKPGPAKPAPTCSEALTTTSESESHCTCQFTFCTASP